MDQNTKQTQTDADDLTVKDDMSVKVDLSFEDPVEDGYYIAYVKCTKLFNADGKRQAANNYPSSYKQKLGKCILSRWKNHDSFNFIIPFEDNCSEAKIEKSIQELCQFCVLFDIKRVFLTRSRQSFDQKNSPYYTYECFLEAIVNHLAVEGITVVVCS